MRGIVLQHPAPGQGPRVAPVAADGEGQALAPSGKSLPPVVVPVPHQQQVLRARHPAQQGRGHGAGHLKRAQPRPGLPAVPALGPEDGAHGGTDGHQQRAVRPLRHVRLDAPALARVRHPRQLQRGREAPGAAVVVRPGAAHGEMVLVPVRGAVQGGHQAPAVEDGEAVVAAGGVGLLLGQAHGGRPGAPLVFRAHEEAGGVGCGLAVAVGQPQGPVPQPAHRRRHHVQPGGVRDHRPRPPPRLAPVRRDHRLDGSAGVVRAPSNSDHSRSRPHLAAAPRWPPGAGASPAWRGGSPAPGGGPRRGWAVGGCHAVVSDVHCGSSSGVSPQEYRRRLLAHWL